MNEHYEFLKVLWKVTSTHRQFHTKEFRFFFIFTKRLNLKDVLLKELFYINHEHRKVWSEMIKEFNKFKKNEDILMIPN